MSEAMRIRKAQGNLRVRPRAHIGLREWRGAYNLYTPCGNWGNEGPFEMFFLPLDNNIPVISGAVWHTILSFSFDSARKCHQRKSCSGSTWIRPRVMFILLLIRFTDMAIRCSSPLRCVSGQFGLV
jgi:hypothetical protein